MTEPARTHLQLVNPETGEVHDGPSYSDLLHQTRDLEDQLAGFKVTCEKQAREIGSLRRRIADDEDPTTHPQGKEIVALIERWMRGTRHNKAKVSADRVKLVKSRLRDGYPLTSDDEYPAEATLELAVDGIAAYPFVVNGQRVREGKPSQRHDRLGIALAGGEKVEEFARLGYQARKAGIVTWGEA